MRDDIPKGDSPYVRQETPPDGFEEYSYLWNDADYGTAFRDAVRRFGDRPAIQGPGGQLTFHELDRLSDEVASGITSRVPTRKEVPIAVWMAHDLWIVPVLIGIMKSGAMAVPLDPMAPPAQVTSIIADAGARLLLVDAERHGEVETGCPAEVLDWEDARDRDLEGALDPLPVGPDDGATIFYTSGSTGEPKGVDCTHRTLLHGAWNAINGFWLGPYDRMGMVRPLASAAATGLSLVSMLGGVTVCLYDVRGAGVAGLPAWLRSEQITVFPVVPPLIRGLGAGGVEQRFEALRLLMISGERVDPEDIELGRRLAAHGATVLTVLGSTETFMATWYFFGPEDPLPTSRVPIGFPLPDITAAVVGADGVEVPTGEVGEFTVTSAFFARGYWRRPDLTAQAFRPTGDGRVTFRTGDLARDRGDGALEHAGRNDSQVKIRGHRVEIGAIESALLGVDGIEQAVVIVRGARGGPSLTGYYVASDDALDPEDVRRRLEAVLEAHAVPSVLVGLESLPLLPSGKVDRQALPEVNIRLPRAAVSDMIRPSDPLERDLIGIWELVLGIAPIGVEDDVLELCEDSLRVTSFVAAADEALGLKIPFAAFLDASTVRELAQFIRAREREAEPSPMSAIQTHGDRTPLLFPPDFMGSAYRFRFLVDTLGEDQPLYGFESPLHDGRAHRDATVESMARAYIEAAQAVWPEGPYHLAGWSFGAFVAYEMARQLTASGHEVGFLGLVDAGPALISEAAPENMRNLRKPPRPPRGKFPGAITDPTQEERSLGAMRSRALDRGKSLVSRLVPQGALDRVIWSVDLRRHGQVRPSRRVPYTWYRSKVAGGRYHWQPYDGDVHLFTMRERSHPDRTYGLDRLVRGHLDVRFISLDCARNQLMDPPWVDTVGTMLREALDEVTGQGGTETARTEPGPGGS